EARVCMDYETLAALNPRLIYAAVSALGTEGPEASSPGYDIVVQSRVGMLSQHRDAHGVPLPSKVMSLDMSGSMGLSYAIMVALWERERTGLGQRIDMSLFQVGLMMLMPQMVSVENPESRKLAQPSGAVLSCCQCSDGQWVLIVINEDHQFRALCRVLDLEHLANDPRLATFDKRIELTGELREIMEAVIIDRPSDEWLDLLRAAGVPSSIVAEPDAVSNDPQAIANKMFLTQDHPAVGRVKMVAPPFHLSNSRDETRLCRPAPKLGQHTAEILREFGYDDVTIAGYLEREIVK
ncbi:MAG: CaiB/BaiF CoA-transferase family protein, partial [Dehalococcoidia bacterium]|nr:CaiB/BaiF CoA-transferase family protein [Dehalococcoidia bacterium]